jgi:hypothetical protein
MNLSISRTMNAKDVGEFQPIPTHTRSLTGSAFRNELDPYSLASGYQLLPSTAGQDDDPDFRARPATPLSRS